MCIDRHVAVMDGGAGADLFEILTRKKKNNPKTTPPKKNPAKTINRFFSVGGRGLSYFKLLF